MKIEKFRDTLDIIRENIMAEDSDLSSQEATAAAALVVIEAVELNSKFDGTFNGKLEDELRDRRRNVLQSPYLKIKK